MTSVEGDNLRNRFLSVLGERPSPRKSSGLCRVGLLVLRASGLQGPMKVWARVSVSPRVIALTRRAGESLQKRGKAAEKASHQDGREQVFSRASGLVHFPGVGDVSAYPASGDP